MINLINLRSGCIECSKSGIVKQACFGRPEDGTPKYCKSHSTDEMIDLRNQKKNCVICMIDGINKRAIFGELGQQPSRCFEHKNADMFDLSHANSNCSVCNKRATYGFIGSKPVSCKTHKSGDMIDLNNQNKGCIVCKTLNIFKRASYGKIGDKAIYCSEHKTDEAVDLNNQNKSCVVCKENGVLRIASYGKLFEKKTHCKAHSLPNEFFRNEPKCDECSGRPYFGQERTDLIPKRCHQHKKDTDIDMISRECVSCLYEVYIPSNQTKCALCLGWNIKKQTNRGVKENRVSRCLTTLSKTTGICIPMQDRVIKNGCSKRRPDFYYKDFTDSFSLIVEVDEHQHSHYTCSIEGEFRRIINLYEEDSGGFPLIFIRFNPDSYYYKNNIICSYDFREKKLIDTIKGLKNRIDIDFAIGIIYLFYDNFENVEIEPFKYTVSNGQIIVRHKHPLSLKTEHIISI